MTEDKGRTADTANAYLPTGEPVEGSLLDEPSEARGAVGAPFRVMTLVVGLGVFAGLVWILLRL